MRCILFITGLILIIGCQVQPTPIYYGQDSCHACKMTIVDQQHAAQLVTKKGKVYKYDAIECLLGDKKTDDEYSFILVCDYEKPGQLLDATTSFFLISKLIPSPMGAYLSAFSDNDSAERHIGRGEAQVFSWSEIALRFPGNQSQTK